MKRFALFLILVSLTAAYAQDEASQAPPAVATKPAVQPVTQMKLSDFESAVIMKLREQFPRLPAFFTVAHSCRLPNYGPLISVTIQPPSTFFVRPLLWQLEQRQKEA